MTRFFAIFCMMLLSLASCTNSKAGGQMLDETENEEEARRNPQEIRRGIPMGGVEGRNRQRVYFERIAQKIEPGLVGTPDRLPLYIDLYKREMITDLRLFATDVEAAWDDDRQTVVLTGYVMFEENSRSLVNLLEVLGFTNIDNRIETLPSERLGEKKFAIVKASRGFIFDRPEEPHETLNEALFGDPVFLLKPADNGYYLCAMRDGYIGYIHGDHIERVDSQTFEDYLGGDSVTLLRDQKVAGTIDGVDYIPAGTRLKIPALREDETSIRVILPPGIGRKSLELAPTDVTIHPAGPDERTVAAVETAKQLLGTDYVWGGTSSSGVDCSGLVQSAYQSHGIYLARDASMQIYAGRLVATRWHREGMQFGDLMYFLGGNGKVTHTAIYIGDGTFLEASGEVKFTSLNPGDENYSERRDQGFCFARRLFQ